MMWLVKFLQKRPTDKTIRISRVLFWSILVLALWYNLIYLDKAIDTRYFWQDIDEKWIIIWKYIMIFIWIIPIIIWLTNICLFKSKYMRIIQIIFAVILFYISGSIVESPDLDIDVLVWIMWILPLIAWITWKCTTKKCLRHWEKITKIRV